MGYSYKKGSKRYSYGTRGYKSSSSRFSRRTTASFKSGTSRVTVSIPVTADYQLAFAANSKLSAVIPHVPTRDLNDSSMMSLTQTYKAYANLYDQARIVGVKLKWNFGGGFTSSTGFFTFFTAIDRCFMSTDLSRPMSADEVIGSASVNRTTFTVQQRLGAMRSYYASTLLEKTTWWDTTLDDTNSRYIPALLDSTTAFKPCIYFCAEAPSSSTSTQSLPYRLQTEWILEFRNPKLTIPNTNRALTFDPAFYPDYAAKNPDSEAIVLTEPQKVKTEEEDTMDIEDDPGTS